MSLPVIQMDVVFLTGIVIVSLVIGALIVWLMMRRRSALSTDEQKPSDTRLLLQLMSRADHTLDNYITSIQGHLYQS